MVNVIGVRFRKNGKINYLKKDKIKVSNGNYVIVQTRHGYQCGQVVLEDKQLKEDLAETLQTFIRIATSEDLIQFEKTKEYAKEAMEVFRKCVKTHGLKMELIDCDYIFDKSKVIFYFVAEQRVDFRQIVKELAGIFRIRIELRQVGVRDKARLVGGIGICGKVLCCSTFLSEFHPVSIKMAKDQNISLNPSKISGACDRLMCCLNYENEAYGELLKDLPRLNSIVQTADGEGEVVETNALKGNVKVNVKSDTGIVIPGYYEGKDVKVLKEPEETGETY